MLKNNKLRKEIFLALLLKSVLLSALWFLCFSAPTEQTASPKALSQHLFDGVPSNLASSD